MPRSSQTYSLRDDLLEQARREMLRRRQATTRSITFPEWLNDVSPDFTWDWAYLQYIQEHLQKVTDGEIRKLMLFMPPRHGKSALTTVRYPIYRMEQNLGIRVMLGCYDQSLANLFSRLSRRRDPCAGRMGDDRRRQLPRRRRGRRYHRPWRRPDHHRRPDPVA